MGEEALEALVELVASLLLEMVMVSTFYNERVVSNAFPSSCFIETLTMPYWDDFVTGAMYYKHWATNIFYLVDICEHVSRQREAELEWYPVNGHHRTL